MNERLREILRLSYLIISFDWVVGGLLLWDPIYYFCFTLLFGIPWILIGVALEPEEEPGDWLRDYKFPKEEKQ